MDLPGAPARRATAATSSDRRRLRRRRARAPLRHAALRLLARRDARARSPRYQRALAGRDHLVCYAMKANSNLAVLQSFADAGCGFDIVSGGELERVLAAGGDPARVVFSGVGKTRAEMRARARRRRPLLQRRERRRARAAVDGGARSAAHARASACASIPTSTPKTHPYISTGLQRQQVRHRPRATRSPRTARAAALPGHRGGRHRLPHRLADHRGRALPRRARPPARPGRGASRPTASPLAAHRPRRRPRHHLRRRDAARRRARWSRACSSASTRAATASARSLLEPGRSLVGNAGVLVSEVLYLKPGEREELLHRRRGDERPDAPGDVRRLDAHRRMRARRRRAAVRCDVVGPVCESGDWLGRDRALARRGRATSSPCSRPAPTRMSMASNYNTAAARRRGDGRRRARRWLIRERESARRPDARRAPARLTAPAARRRRGSDPPFLDRVAGDRGRRRSRSSVGRSRRQRSLACGQRGLKVQPAGGLSGFGTSPCTGVRARPLMWMSGIASSSMRVYGWRGRANSARLVGELDDAAEVHHADLVADVAHDREVVRDEQIGQAVPRAAGPS